MEIRLARDEDYVEIARLRKQTIRNVNSEDYSEEVIHNWSSKEGAQDFIDSADTCKRWVALEKGRIIGFSEHNFECELSRIYVHKDYLRKGVGSRLLEIVEHSLEKQGCKEIRIESTITAKDFYEKNGYKVIKKTIYKEDGASIYKMIKRLPELL
tara:strand:- start:299 stop:763 length:465 start_codon:yes stop_codon:yes gene_type:complete